MAADARFPFRTSHALIDTIARVAMREDRSGNRMIEVLVLEALKARKEPVRMKLARKIKARQAKAEALLTKPGKGRRGVAATF